MTATVTTATGVTAAPATHIHRVAILSTYFENIGDDLIRHGLTYQLNHVLGHEPHLDHISKSNRLSILFPTSPRTHAPVQRMTAREKRAARFKWRVLLNGRLLPHMDKVSHADLFVVGGTPLFYFVGDKSFVELEDIYSENWPEEVFNRRVDRDGGPAVIGMGVGSVCEGDPCEVLPKHPAAQDFLARFMGRAKLVTVRDATTEKLLRAASAGRAERVVKSHCPSIWACRGLGIEPGAARRLSDRVLVGYSQESADWDTTGSWDDTVSKRQQALAWTIELLKGKGYEVQLVCHNKLDSDVQPKLAEKYGIAPPITLDAKSLLEEANRAMMMVTWRVHGSMAALSVGCPVLLFKTDSRYQMADELGADVLDDRDLRKADLADALDRLAERAATPHDQRIAYVDQRRDSQLALITERFREALA